MLRSLWASCRAWTAPLALAVAVGLTALGCGRSRASGDASQDGAERRLARAKHGQDMVRFPAHQREARPFFSPLNDARWLEAGAAAHMHADDVVLGFQSGDGAWALPWWVMKNHHVANLVLGGRPVLVAFCENCSSGGAFDPVIDGRPFTFRLEGAYKGTIMLQDEPTGSLWTGFTGESIHGPRKGTVMERLPLVQCRWDEWLAAHPRTQVVDGAGEARDGHGSGKRPGEVQKNGKIGVSGTLVQIDRRLPHNKMVLGVKTAAAARCYPLDRLRRLGRAFNDALGGEEIVVFSRPGSLMAIAFQRRLDGRLLEFRTRGEAIIDERTGSEWDMAGRAVSGPLQGSSLNYVHSGVEEFYIWASFHPDTDVLGQDAATGVAAR